MRRGGTVRRQARRAIAAASLAGVALLGCRADKVAAPAIATEGVYRFGAKFEPPAGRVVHGIGQWADYNARYAALLPASSQPASELLFVNIPDSPRPWNAAQIAASVAAIDARGRVPLVNITMHGPEPTQAQLALLPDPYYAIDDEIANGTAWDARLQELVAVFKAYRKPVLMRIGGEFSGWWNGYHPYDYPRAFRKIVGMFRAAAVDNVAFVWCYEPAAADDFDAKDATGASKWYPGDDVVDWFSIDWFAKEDMSGATSVRGANTSYGKSLRFLNMAVAARKPVVIAESAPALYDFTSAAAADAAWSEWFSPYFALIATHSEIEWFTYVDYDWTQAAYYAAEGWKNNDLSVAGALASRYVAEVTRSRYLHASELALLKDYARYK